MHAWTTKFALIQLHLTICWPWLCTAFVREISRPPLVSPKLGVVAKGLGVSVSLESRATCQPKSIAGEIRKYLLFARWSSERCVFGGNQGYLHSLSTSQGISQESGLLLVYRAGRQQHDEISQTPGSYPAERQDVNEPYNDVGD
ncbi:uncharacterized protein LY79DRAFT_662046 [Colletotrichum navitas]|uniref:Secreted protein n=1 Tax=Colletotrichum navitas TaxID=681940 RepID=A0AAD8PR12_9PEZI|nr:uncharacterized protein LY79DRAFT_662046 [Colletotrichum navitas]KAK1574667.1 hypothetical protein LY79DRAFT_662046 [Colletotrichum navitas]